MVGILKLSMWLLDGARINYGIMVLTYLETEKYKSVKHIMKSMEKKHGSNPYMEDATEVILPICKCLLSIMTVTNIATEK